MAKTKKCYVFDTSTLLTDPLSIEKVRDENGDNVDVFLNVGVLSELDKIKTDRKKTQDVKRNARVISRVLYDYVKKGIVEQGVIMKSGNVLNFINLNDDLNDKVVKPDKPVDDLVILTALQLQQDTEDKEVVTILSQDINLCVRANIHGVYAEMWDKNKSVDNLDDLYTGIVRIQLEDGYGGYLSCGKKDLPIDDFEKGSYKIITEGYSVFSELPPNACCILQKADEDRKFYAIFNKRKKQLELFCGKEMPSEGGFLPINDELIFLYELMKKESVKILTVAGDAGTGKTLNVLNMAYRLVVKNLGNYKKLQVIRPNIPQGEDMGFLPGGIEEKFGPFVIPIVENLELILGKEFSDNSAIRANVEEMFGPLGQVKVDPINYIKGRTLHDTILLVDEAQDFTKAQLKSIITRLGRNSKVIIVGDSSQVVNDSIDQLSNGLACVVEIFKPEFVTAHVRLKKILRSEIAALAARLL